MPILTPNEIAVGSVCHINFFLKIKLTQSGQPCKIILRVEINCHTKTISLGGVRFGIKDLHDICDATDVVQSGLHHDDMDVDLYGNQLRRNN